ncbi:hypothetical protein BTO30_16210 [Domibacillus antri]|uniref:Type I restriction modification DNA specificity domain-containing protein n=1 Tax=Domibacillus antri TaxID=1714264 RepID=A0A1Q8Q1M7_9BACI|nr:restriction endonuclease subunit S [Domibacillus antri]OLN21222.1 hypothetical protein BTO30_16210 [Domibacillus antri]
MQNYKLENLCDVKSSKRIYVSDYVEDGVPFFRGKEITELSANLKLSEQLFISYERYNEIKEKFGAPVKDDILLTAVGTIGNSYMVEKEPLYFKDGNLIWFTNYKTDIVLPEYLYIVFNSSWFKKTLIQKGQIGSVQNALTIEKVKRIEIPIPSLEAQKDVIKNVNLLNRKIKLNIELIDNLNEYTELIFHKWFVDFNFPDKDGKPYKDNSGEMSKNSGKLVPVNWKPTTIGVITINYDNKRIPLSDSVRTKRRGIYPYYGATQIMDYIDDYIFNGVYCLIAEDGSVIDENNRPIMQLAWGKFWVNNHAHVLQGKGNISTEYIYLSLKRTNILGAVTGAIQKKINQQNLNRLPAILPSNEIMVHFNQIVQPLFKKIMELTDENSLLKEIRNLLVKKFI